MKKEIIAELKKNVEKEIEVGKISFGFYKSMSISEKNSERANGYKLKADQIEMTQDFNKQFLSYLQGVE